MIKKITGIIRKTGMFIKGIYIDNKDFAFDKCYDVYPPSFYIMNTEEEAKRIIEEDIHELEKLINRYKKERCPD